MSPPHWGARWQNTMKGRGHRPFPQRTLVSVLSISIGKPSAAIGSVWTGTSTKSEKISALMVTCPRFGGNP